MRQTILVIEDEPAVADAITYALNTDGFESVWKATGREGMAALEAQEPHLVVLDVGLPDGNGFELCKEIRKTSRVPVIFLTARSNEVDRVVGLEIGGDDYMVKPFSPRELVARVKAVLRRTRPDDGIPPGRLASGFVVDERQCLIRYGDTALDLSRYEYRILKTLICHPGWVFSREKLMDLAWESPEASMDRTVDTHIKTIRAKLRAIQPHKDPIKTHRGLGYSLKEDS